MTSYTDKTATRDTHLEHFFTSVLQMLPLCLAVLPWGLLAGSMAVQAGLTFWQSIGTSAIIFAGAAQLVTLGLLMSGASVATIIISVFFITWQHFLYGLSLREYISIMRLRYRLPIGFLLTDELFALSSAQTELNKSPSYLIGAGLMFYVCWVLFSLAGVIMASSIPDLHRYHLDFSIVATFVAIVDSAVMKYQARGQYSGFEQWQETRRHFSHNVSQDPASA